MPRSLTFPGLQPNHLGFWKGRGLTYRFADEFSQAQAAPLSAPLAADRVGSWDTITDTNSRLSKSGGLLKLATGSVTHEDPLLATQALYARKVGLALMARVNLNGSTAPLLDFGFNKNLSVSNSSALPNNGHLFRLFGLLTNIGVWNGVNVTGLAGGGNGTSQAISNVGWHDYTIILRSIGAWFFYDDTLLWVSNGGNATPQRIVVGPEIADSNPVGLDAEFVKLADLQASGFSEWANDYWFAHLHVAGSVAAGTTFTHPADFIASWVNVYPSAGTFSFKFRQQDVNNYWELTINSARSIRLNEIVNGVSTQRASATGAATGYRLQLRVSGTQILAHLSQTSSTTEPTGETLVMVWNYTTAVNFQTATSGVLNSVGTGGAMSDFVIHPCHPPADVINALTFIRNS